MLIRSRNQPSRDKIEWIGKVKKCRKMNPYTHSYNTYEGFKFNNIAAYVGDFVLVSNADTDEPDTIGGCDVARIEHLFQSRDNDKYRANVQWYSKPRKIPQSIDSDHMDDKYEVVEDGRKFDSNISIESIYKTCHVVNTYEDEIPEEVYRKNEEDFETVFVCRYRLYQKRNKFYVEPVLKLDGMLIPDEINNVDKNIAKFIPNSIINEEPKDIVKSKGAQQKPEGIMQTINAVTPKSKRSALWKCSIDSESESSRTSSLTRNPLKDDLDSENSLKSTPRKNSRSTRKSETPLKSNGFNTLGLNSDCLSIEIDERQNISKNAIAKIPNKSNDIVKDTPTKTNLSNSTRKRKALRSSSEESLEPRSRSISPEIDCAGPPAAFQLFQTDGQTFVIKKPIEIERKVLKELDESSISCLLSSDESDGDTIFEPLKKSGTKIVARSKPDNTGFELMCTPNKDIKSLINIREDNQTETPKSARRNLSQTLNIGDGHDTRKELLLKKIADKREDASLRIKLRRSSEQSNYKIDSDSDNNVHKKSRRPNVSTPKSILKVNSKRPDTPNVQFSNQDEINEYSPTTKLSQELLKIEIKVKRLDMEEIRQYSRSKEADSRYANDFQINTSPATKNESPKKRIRNTIDSDEDDNNGIVPRITRQLKRLTGTISYCESSNETKKTSSRVSTRSVTTENKMESSSNEVDDSNDENCPNRTPRKTRYSVRNSVKDSNGILNDQLKTPIRVSEMNRRNSTKMTKNELGVVEDLSSTPKKTRRTVSTDIISTPSQKSTEMDYEQIEPVTPKRNALTPKLQTPSRSVRHGLLTPSMRARNMSVSKPSTPLQQARARLHVSAIPKSLPCREEEFNKIYTFLEGKLMGTSGGCLYISGVPGTGKTATANEVIRCLKKSVTKGKINDFEFVQINGMKLTEPRQAYVEILRQLDGKKATWEQAQQLLDKRFSRAAPGKLMTLLLVDELDILCNKRQDVVYNLLDWPAKSCARLVVITIANTMDLPERVLTGRVTSRLGLTRQTFQPYTHMQLQEIVTTRLNDSRAFKSEAIQLVARKVAAVSGDARRALDICRRATEVAEVNNSETVSMQDVNQALTEMIASATVQAIRHCSEMERAFLQAVCAEVARTGVEEVTFNNIYIQLTSLCSLEGLQVPSVTEAITICAKLGASRLLICEHSRADIHQRVLLNVSSDDVHFSMQINEI